MAKIKLSKTSLYHYWKFAFHSLMFVGVLVIYIINRVQGLESQLFKQFEYTQIVLLAMWLIFVFEMIFRFFPSKIESMGCQKIFNRNYKPTSDKPKIPNNISWKRTLSVALAWIALNSIFGMLYFLNIFDDGILILISLFYSICDMICILFFCPFQTWFMKNKCCNTCRIYNWDYAMICTPLIFIPNIFTWSLVTLSLLLLIKWEIVLKVHPERFAENTNQSLKCANCTEKLCAHKKQLQAYLKKFRAMLEQVEPKPVLSEPVVQNDETFTEKVKSHINATKSTNKKSHSS